MTNVPNSWHVTPYVTYVVHDSIMTNDHGVITSFHVNHHTSSFFQCNFLFPFYSYSVLHQLNSILDLHFVLSQFQLPEWV